jgi:hypothetical protein
MTTKTTHALALVMALAAASAATAGMGVSRGQDLDALWTAAQQGHDLQREDAVLLLESRSVDVGADGAVATTVHRVVWIGTSQGIRGYADLRVPWNSATSTLDVRALRTWRDGRWWPDAERISDTAVVHTLPYAVNRADDYTALRETMLLHDGVELPCIMETVYTITERGLPGADGVFVLPQRDPAVRVDLRVSVPAGARLNAAGINGAPAADETSADGRLTHTWSLSPAPALRLPVGADPAAYEPAVAWSTWDGFEAMAAAWSGPFLAAATLDPALADTVAAALAPCAGPWETLQTALAFVTDGVRSVGYDDGFQRFTPRPAGRTWATGYGTALDRAALLAAVLEHAGFTVAPALVSEGFAMGAPDVPRLTAAGGLHLFIDLDGAWAGAAPGGAHGVACEMAHARMVDAASLAARPWLVLGREARRVLAGAAGGRLDCFVTLRPADDGGWRGSAHVDGRGALAAYAATAGTGDELLSRAQACVGAVLPDAEATAASPVMVVGNRVAWGADVTVASPDVAGEDESRRIVIGSPTGGVLDHLPHDVHLADAARQSPVLLDAPLVQQVRVRLVGAAELAAWLPPARELENAAGSFRLTAVRDGADVVVTRVLEIRQPRTPAEAWPDLRALLLEEGDAANGTVVLD